MAKPKTSYCFHVHIGNTGPGTGMHTHDTHEFFFCTSGKGIQHIPDREHQQQKGHLFLFPQGQPHHCTAVDEKGCDGIVLNISDSALPYENEAGTEATSRTVLDRICNSAWKSENLLQLSPRGRDKVEKLFTGMAIESTHRDRGFATAIQIAYQSLLLTILRDENTGQLFHREIQPASGEERIDNVLRFLEGNYMADVKVDDMAAMACMSRSHFHAIFKQETGFSLMEYTNRKRIGAALRLLQDSDRPILDVAISCGFPSLSHFYHIFRRLVGRTPRQVRQGDRVDALQLP